MINIYTRDMEERLVSLDAIRGIALFGILLINIASFTVGGPPGFSKSPNPLDNLVTNILLLLVESKFFTLFSLLFGISFSIQFFNAKKRGKSFELLFARRLIGLFLFGVFHIVMLWSGDILLLYSLVGSILFIFRKSEEKILLKWSIGLLVIPTILLFSLVIIVAVISHMPAYAALIEHANVSFIKIFKEEQIVTINKLHNLGFFELSELRVKEYVELFPLLCSRIPTVLAMFLLGLYIGKRDVFYNVDKYRTILIKVSTIGIFIGLLINIIIVVLFNNLKPITGVLVLLFNQTLTGPILAVSFGALLLLFYHSVKGVKYLTYFAFPGRMALTNYILQSLFYSLVFYGYGLGLIGHITTTQAVSLAILFYIFQILSSQLWLDHFKLGPLEWIWRCLTYWRMVDMKRIR